MKKEVCKTCVNRFLDPIGEWSNNDEQAWANNKIMCPNQARPRKGTDYDYAAGDPPPGCPYALEHQVLGQDQC